MYNDPIPDQVEVLILGGGIHGVGVLHDLASRNFKQVNLIEKKFVGSGTSSKSTKLIHGGLRYLKRLSQFKMVTESLKERDLLLNFATDIVHPLEILIPIAKYDLPSIVTMKTGLALYDTLAGKYGIEKHKICGVQYLEKKAPVLKAKKFSKVFSYWDAQTDDLSLVDRVARSGKMLGGAITENVYATKIRRKEDKILVSLKVEEQKQKEVEASCVVNCLGPWSNKFLTSSDITPPYSAINNKGVHLVIKDMGLKCGLLLPNKKDNRIIFVLPWLGKTLIGTTEELFEGDPSKVRVEQKDIDYLLGACNAYFKKTLKEDDIEQSFAGLRWLVAEKDSSISATTRESLIGENEIGKGLILTIYGGKLTSYRSLAEKVGNRVASHFGISTKTGTKFKNNWFVV